MGGQRAGFPRKRTPRSAMWRLGATRDFVASRVMRSKCHLRWRRELLGLRQQVTPTSPAPIPSTHFMED